MKKFFIIFILSVLILLFGVAIYWMLAMSRLPVEDGDLGNIQEIMVLPERPGTQSLILTGPVVRPLIFTIAVSKPDIQSLDWGMLKDMDLTADVKIQARITQDGTLLFDPIDDVYCPGHTKAGEMISRVLQTWSYTPYRQGSIAFRFNVGAIGKKLTIDISKLQRSEGVDPDRPIKIGALYLIENGLGAGAVKIVNW